MSAENDSIGIEIVLTHTNVLITGKYTFSVALISLVKSNLETIIFIF